MSFAVIREPQTSWLLNLSNSTLYISLNTFCRWRIFYILFRNLESPNREKWTLTIPKCLRLRFWKYMLAHNCLFLNVCLNFYGYVWLCVVCYMAPSPAPWMLGNPATVVFLLAVTYSCSFMDPRPLHMLFLLSENMPLKIKFFHSFRPFIVCPVSDHMPEPQMYLEESVVPALRELAVS